MDGSDSDPEPDGEAVGEEPFKATSADEIYRRVVDVDRSKGALRCDTFAVACEFFRPLVVAIHGEGLAGSAECRRAKASGDGPASRTRSKTRAAEVGAQASKASVRCVAIVPGGDLLVAASAPVTFEVRTRTHWATAFGVKTDGPLVGAAIGSKFDKALPVYIHRHRSGSHRLSVCGGVLGKVDPVDDAVAGYLSAAMQVLEAARITVIAHQVRTFRSTVSPPTAAESARGIIDLVGVQRVGKDGARLVIIDLKTQYDPGAPHKSHALQVAMYAAVVDLCGPFAAPPAGFVLHACLAQGKMQLYQVDLRGVVECTLAAAGKAATAATASDAAIFRALVRAWADVRTPSSIPVPVPVKA
jgi:hypothetical protein